MLRKKISESEQVCTLPNVECILIYTWLIPHVCDFGTFTADPFKIKARIFPEVPGISRKNVQEALVAFVNNALITIFCTDSENPEYVLILNNFEKHQSGLHKRAGSRRPDFSKSRVVTDSAEIMNSSRKFPEVPGNAFREELRTKNLYSVSNDTDRFAKSQNPVDNFSATPILEQPPQPEQPVKKKWQRRSLTDDHKTQAKKIIDFLNRKSGWNHGYTETNMNFIADRMRDGYTPDQIWIVTAIKCGEWKSEEKTRVWLRPKTLYNKTNFETYMGQLPKKTTEAEV